MAAITRLAFASNELAYYTYTIVAGTKRYLLWLTVDSSPTTPVVNGVSMSLLESESDSSYYVTAYGLVVPDSWSAGVVASSGGGRYMKCQFAGVDPNNPIYASDSYKNGNPDTTESITLNCHKSGWVQDIIAVGNQPTQGANQTLDYRAASSGTSYYTTPINGNVTMTWTFTSANSAMIAVSLMPYKQTIGATWFL